MQQTVDSFLAWLVTEKGSAENTIAAYRNDLGQFLGFLSTHTAAETWTTVTERDLRAYLAELQARDYAPATVARKLSAVRSLFHHLVLTGVLDDDPAAQVSAGRVLRPPPEQLPRQAIQQLSDSVDADSPLDLRDRALIALLAGVGLKASQVIGLDLEDLDLQPGAGTVRVRGRRGKEEGRALPPAVRADLARYLDEGWPLLAKGTAGAGPSPPLFLNARGQRLTRQGLWVVLKGRGEAAGLEQGVSPRALRRNPTVSKA